MTNTAWCRQLYNSLADNGVWAVPRSGLVFTKKDGALVLTARMPYDERMPGDAAALSAYQQNDYECIKREFAAAGIDVKQEVKL